MTSIVYGKGRKERVVPFSLEMRALYRWLYGQIMALAVELDHQQRRVGRLLIQTAEFMLVDRGAHVLVVTSETIGLRHNLSRKERLHV